LGQAAGIVRGKRHARTYQSEAIEAGLGRFLASLQCCGPFAAIAGAKEEAGSLHLNYCRGYDG
jgi:hypothetical protein